MCLAAVAVVGDAEFKACRRKRKAGNLRDEGRPERTNMLYRPPSKPSTAAKQVAPRRGYLGHKRSDGERADMAAQHYVQQRPIEAPTLHQLAFAYRIPVTAIQQRLNGKPDVTVDEAVASWRTWTPEQRAEF